MSVIIKPSALVRGARAFSTSTPKWFIGNFFGTKEAKKKEIIDKQDEYEVDASSKIVILNKENSPSFKPFNAAEDMPDFKINLWKTNNVRAEDIEATHNRETLAQAISEAHSDLKGEPISPDQYNQVSLSDLEFRFKFAKTLQLKLGFDINDHTISRAHDVEYLYLELRKVIAHRWSSERNPNAIVLRPEDFLETRNVYLNKERSAEEQQQILNELVERARASTGQ